MTHADRLNAHMRADKAGNKETRDDRALPPSFCRWGCQKKKKKNEHLQCCTDRSPATHHANCRLNETRRAREPGASTNAVDPIAIATVGAATWTYQQPVATMRDINNNLIFLLYFYSLINHRYRHQDLQLYVVYGPALTTSLHVLL